MLIMNCVQSIQMTPIIDINEKVHQAFGLISSKFVKIFSLVPDSRTFPVSCSTLPYTALHCHLMSLQS